MMNQWLRRGALGCVIGLSTLAVPTAAFAYGPGGANNSFGLTLSVSVGVGGNSVTVSAATGPCTPGTGAEISLIRAIPNQTPTLLGGTTVNSAGGLNAISVVIPVGSPVGVYIMFGTCTGTGGVTNVLTASFVVDGPIVAGTTSVYKPPSSVSLSPHWGTPATRTAVQRALTAAGAQAVNTISATSTGGATASGSGSGTSTGGATASGSSTAAGSSGATSHGGTTGAAGRHLVAAGPARTPTQGHLLTTWLIVAAVVVGLALTGLLVLRRRHLPSN